ncbi:hypothetical protein V6N13_040875 [Hibiscus sabdariffa]
MEASVAFNMNNIWRWRSPDVELLTAPALEPATGRPSIEVLGKLLSVNQTSLKVTISPERPTVGETECSISSTPQSLLASAEEKDASLLTVKLESINQNPALSHSKRS